MPASSRATFVMIVTMLFLPTTHLSVHKSHFVNVSFIVNVHNSRAIALNFDVLICMVKGKTCIGFITRPTDLRASLRLFLHSFEVAVVGVICIFLPILNGISHTARIPLGRAGRILRRHGFGNSRRPAAKGIARLLRVGHRNLCAIPGVHRVSAIAAFQIQGQQIVVSIIIDFHLGAAVRRDLGRGVVE